MQYAINQGDTLEKQEQIGRMDDVYGIATKVVAYLGEEADESDLVPPLAESLVNVLLPLEDSLQIEAKDLTRFGLPSVADRRGKALRDLFNRSWFSRKWIIQEFAMAKAVAMVCGPWTFNFELLRNAYSLCLQHGLHRIMCPESQESLTVTKEHPFYTMLVLKDLARHHLDVEDSWGSMTLAWLLINTNAHNAIYSILGVFELLKEFASLPYPLQDYSRPVEEVYTEYAS
jgi:hypothetical protein